MSDYIKREDAKRFLFDRLIETANNNTGYQCDSGIVYQDAAERIRLCWINEIPAADVVEVVRCKDCKWCHSGYCEMYDDLIPFGCANRPWEEWFCADGARMDGEC